MNTAYVNNVPICHGEITVIVSDHAEKTIHHSCKLAETIQKAGVSTLLINCGVSAQRFREAAPKPDVTIIQGEDGPSIRIDGMPHEYYKFPDDENPEVVRARPHMVVHNSTRGDLIGDAKDFDRLILECGIRTVIISGWEWASDSWRKKERLFYFLRRIMEEHDIAVIIYSQASTHPVAGMHDRGGIGKLAMLAYTITDLKTITTLEEVSPKPPPIVATPSQMREAERSAQLLANKINDLGAVVSHQSLVVSEERGKNGKGDKRANMKDKKPVKNGKKVLSAEV